MKLFNLIAIGVFAFILSAPLHAQQDDSNSPVLVQPGAPGKATKVLPSSTSAKLPPVTKADVEFMQGMIHHHAQAVEMVALMKSRTGFEKLLLLGSRISQSQAEEMKFMKRWLIVRGMKTSMSMNMPKTKGLNMPGLDDRNSKHAHHIMPMMPGMLTPKQMKALANAKDSEFDKLFLTGMIQHHAGALVMVDELFASPGAGQDAEMFTFATDVDSGQRAEIRIMQNMLREKTNK